jgi:hypothetical protein
LPPKADIVGATGLRPFCANNGLMRCSKWPLPSQEITSRPRTHVSLYCASLHGLTLAQGHSGSERLDLFRRLLTAVPDCVNFSRIGDVASWISVEHDQVGKFAVGQYATIIKL